MRIGFGIDVHAFGPGDFLMLGGVRVAHTRGVVAHSDGDVVLHALCDALLGAAGLGDIGQHFKDTDPKWRGADSSIFVTQVLALLRARRLAVANVDLTVLAQAPKLTPISALPQVDASAVLGHVKTLASDALEGRAPGSPGEEKTVAYLVDAFKKLGLKPGNPDGTFIQKVPLVGITATPAPQMGFSERVAQLLDRIDC